MKRFFPVLLLISAALILLCCSALAVTSGDFDYYSLDDGTVRITGYSGDQTDLVVPETIDGYTVSMLTKFSYTQIRSLTSITIPNSVTTVQPGFFSDAVEMKEIRVADDHPTLVYRDGVLYNKEDQSLLCYLRCNPAEHFDIPDGIRVIERYAFDGAPLVSVNVPAGVERLSQGAFIHCEALKEITLSEGLKAIETNTFYNNKSLESILIPASVTDIAEESISNCESLTEIRVAPGNPVYTVIDGALVNTQDGVLIAYPANRDAETFTIPESVTRIGENAFYWARNLKHVVFPEGLLEIGGAAFCGCGELTEAYLPDSLTALGFQAFSDCRNLTHLRLPPGITKINGQFDSSGLTELIIPETVTSIKYCTFLKNLTEVVIPSGVTKIESSSFNNNKNLVSVTIPASVTEMGEAKYMFHDNAEDFTLKVEAGSYAEQWCQESGVRYTVIASSVPAPAETPAPADTASAVQTPAPETPVSRPPEAATGPMAEFAAAFAQHADALEESFEIPCTEELQELLFQNCSVEDTTYINAISISAGMIRFSYRKHPDKIEFLNCVYYEGKRIVHAWKNGTVSELTPREQETLQAAQRMVAGVSGPELEKEKAVHDLLCRHVTYYDDGSMFSHEESDCAVGAILNGQADCDGYSDAFYLLGSLAGLEVRLVKGDSVPDPDQSISAMIRNLSSGGHVWNLVHVGGKWVMLDVTWDDQGEKGICYTYFNTGTAGEAKKHVWEPQIMYLPVETESGNDVRPSGLEWIQISDWDGLRTALQGSLGRRDRICLRYTPATDLRAESDRFSTIVYSLGVEKFSWAFGGDNAEIYGMSMYPEYRVVSTRQELVNYLAGCRSRRPQEIRVYCPRDLFDRLIANDGKDMFAAMKEAGLKTVNLHYGSETCVFIISPPEW